MATKNDLLFTENKHQSFFNKHSAIDKSNQFLNLNLKQNDKSSISISDQFYSKLNNDKCFDSTISDNYEKKRKSESWNKSSDNFCLNSLTHNDRIEVDEAKKIWKKDSKTINNSILSLQIEAYENSIKAAPDSFDVKNTKALTKEKFGSNKNQKNAKQIFAVSNFVFQNPFEFSRQQNDKVWRPGMFHFRASQRLYNPNTNYNRKGYSYKCGLNSAKMDDLTFGIEEELELDYEAEEARKAKEIAAARNSKSIDEEEAEGEAEEEVEESDKFGIKPIFSINSRKRKSSPIRWNRGIIGDNDEVEPGQDIIRKKKTHKRFRYQPQLLPAIFFPDERDPDEPLDEGTDEHPALTRYDIEELFDSLDVDMEDDTVPLNTIYVYGTEGMTHYQIEKIFAEYNPHIVLFVDDESCIVQFRQSRLTAKMLIGMTKKLKRVRKAKKIEEEGEIMDSDGEEEDGQIKSEDGEFVQIVNKDLIIDVTDVEKEEIEIDIKSFKVPKGKWRVVSKHIQSNKILIVRYAKQTEIQKANRNTANTEYRTERSSNSVKNRNRAKCGINVFDSTGKELPWNFEHDTRIFQDPALKGLEVSYEIEKKQDGPEKPHEENIQIGDRTIRSRGRGTKRALNLHFSSDDESEDESEKEEEADDTTMNKAAGVSAKSKTNNLIDDSILNSPTPSPPKPSDNFRNQILKKQ